MGMGMRFSTGPVVLAADTAAGRHRKMRSPGRHMLRGEGSPGPQGWPGSDGQMGHAARVSTTNDLRRASGCSSRTPLRADQRDRELQKGP